MKRRILITCLLLSLAAITFAFLPSLYARWTTNATVNNQDELEAYLIAALDDCIQERFKDIDNGFGFRRVRDIDGTPHRFKPENAKELSVVSDLNKHKLSVALYLAGRRALQSRQSTRDEKTLYSRNVINGPVLITPTDQQETDLPESDELWDQSHKAMAAFERSDRYNFTVGKWRFIARPVKASEETCLNCHKSKVTTVRQVKSKDGQWEPLQIGDVLGVILYAYEARQ